MPNVHTLRRNPFAARRGVTRALVLPALLLGASFAFTGHAVAQSTQRGAASSQAPNMPPPAATVPEKIDPPLDPAPDMTGTLSDKLNKTDGVIAPPSGVDPEIHKQAPEGNSGRMPVIPPPGSPGSSSNVDPK
jgi:hypothetical protein